MNAYQYLALSGKRFCAVENIPIARAKGYRTPRENSSPRLRKHALRKFASTDRGQETAQPKRSSTGGGSLLRALTRRGKDHNRRRTRGCENSFRAEFFPHGRKKAGRFQTDAALGRSGISSPFHSIALLLLMHRSFSVVAYLLGCVPGEDRRGLNYQDFSHVSKAFLYLLRA